MLKPTIIRTNLLLNTYFTLEMLNFQLRSFPSSTKQAIN